MRHRVLCLRHAGDDEPAKVQDFNAKVQDFNAMQDFNAKVQDFNAKVQDFNAQVLADTWWAMAKTCRVLVHLLFPQLSFRRLVRWAQRCASVDFNPKVQGFYARVQRRRRAVAAAAKVQDINRTGLQPCSGGA